MLHELKRYRAHPGKADALRARFLAVTVPIFSRLGITVVHCWTSPQDPDLLYYLVQFPDEAARDAGWAAFGSDPQWKKAKADSELDGPLLAEQSTVLLRPELLASQEAA